MRKVLLALILIPLMVSAKIYHIVENGVDSYSDTPQHHAREINIDQRQRFKATKAKAYKSDFQRLVQQEKPQITKNHYQNIALDTPVDDQSIWNQANIPVTVTTQPALQKNDLIQLVINGSTQPAQASNQFVLSELPRGTYSLKAVIVNQKKIPYWSPARLSFMLNAPLPANAAHRRNRSGYSRLITSDHCK